MKRRQAAATFGPAWAAKHEVGVVDDFARLVAAWADVRAAFAVAWAPAMAAVASASETVRDVFKKVWEQMLEAKSWLEGYDRKLIENQLAELLTIPDPPLVLLPSYRGRPYDPPDFRGDAFFRLLREFTNQEPPCMSRSVSTHLSGHCFDLKVPKLPSQSRGWYLS